MNNAKRKKQILGYVKDLVADFTYYDRKEDEDLTEKRLDMSIENGVVTIDELTDAFRKSLEKVYN